MKWSKLKKELKNRLAESVNKELDFFMTEYVGSWSKRSWITMRGVEVVYFSTAESFRRYGLPLNELTIGGRWATHPKVSDSDRTPGLLMEKGEFSSEDFTHCCWQFLHMGIEEAQISNHPILRMLAVLDKRTGKNKLAQIASIENHPMVLYFIKLRVMQ